MPYDVGKGHGCTGSKPWAVYNSETGEKRGCHPTEESAKRQQRALYANVPDADKEVNEEQDGTTEKYGSYPEYTYEWRPYLGAVSFRELEEIEEAGEKTRAIEELNSQFSSLARNIMQDPEIDDKGNALSALVSEYSERLKIGPTMGSARGKGLLTSVKDAIFGGEDMDDKSAIKRENGMDFPARDYAYAPDPAKPSTWRVRLTESPGKVTLTQLTRAAMLLRTEKTSGVPASALNHVRRRVRAEFRKLGVSDAKLPPSVREGARILHTSKESDPSFSIWKSESGQYYWMAVYSNKYRDDDHPPEIISEKSHKAFTYLANNGVVPMPELWHWHVKGTRWGVATHLDYVDGFALAIGTVDEGHEKEAELIAQRDDIGVSHGMMVRHIIRNKDDDSVIDFHITHEISDLVLANAANKRTDFVVLSKERNDMPLSDSTKKYLNEIGLDPDQIANVEAGLAAGAKAADDAGIESKEETQDEDVQNDAEMEQADADQEKSSSDDVVTKAEFAEVIADLLSPMSDAIKSISERLAAAESTIQEIRVSDEQKVAEKAEMTPTASLREIVAQAIVGNKEAQIDGRLKEAQGPKETPNPVPNQSMSGWLDGVMSKSSEMSK